MRPVGAVFKTVTADVPNGVISILISIKKKSEISIKKKSENTFFCQKSVL